MAKDKFKVKANKETISGYDSELEIEVDNTYEAYFKGNIPEPTQYTDESGTMTITWFNNFGVREKKSKKDSNVEYTVKLKKLPPGKILFLMYPTPEGNKIEKIGTSDAGNGKVTFSFNQGDPATGSAP